MPGSEIDLALLSMTRHLLPVKGIKTGDRAGKRLTSLARSRLDLAHQICPVHQAAPFPVRLAVLTLPCASQNDPVRLPVRRSSRTSDGCPGQPIRFS